MRRVVAAAVVLAALSVGSPRLEATTSSERCPKQERLLRQYFPADVVPTMSRIMWRESRCLETAVGWNYKRPYGPANCRRAPFEIYLKTCRYIASFDSGYLQVNSSWSTVTKRLCGRSPREGALLEAKCNLEVAKWLYENGGLGHWRATSGPRR